MKKWHLSFFAISIVFCSCVLFSRFQPGAAEFEKLKEATSTEEAREQFNRYPVGTQIDIYLFGLKYIEPDDNSTQKFLVDDGEKKVSTIIERIRDTNEEFDKAYLMETVSLIEKDCDCAACLDDRIVLVLCDRTNPGPIIAAPNVRLSNGSWAIPMCSSSF